MHEKTFSKLDKTVKEKIKSFTDYLITLPDPTKRGQRLQGDFSGLWKFRVGDYRLICDVNGHELIIYTVKIGHRREIYKKK